MKRLISLPTAFIVFFLIFVVPSVLSADSKNIWQDDSCIVELKNSNLPEVIHVTRWSSWHQHVSKVFVGEVIWAQPPEEAVTHACGFAGFNRRDVRHKVMEILMGDMKLGSEVTLTHDWCDFFEEIYPLGAKFIIGLNFTLYSKFPEREPNGKVAWELPFNPENRENAKTFIQCIQDLGLVKAMEEENEE